MSEAGHTSGGAVGALQALGRLWSSARAGIDAMVDSMLGAESIERLSRVPVQEGDAGVDPFGFDVRVARYMLVVAQWIYKHYFRVQVHGLENVPDGRVLLIANHSGQLPLDGVAIGTAIFLEGKKPRIIRSMVEKWTATLPFVATLFPRVGQIVGVPENCIRLLEMDEAVLVFPEGTRGISKTFDRRYKLAEFGLGFMRMALQTGTPIVPVAVVGAEEQYISVANIRPIARLVGAPAFPVMPQLLFPGGFLPLPTRYRVYFGEPLTFQGDPDDEDAVIEEKVQVVRQTVQSMINRGLKERTSIFF